MLSDYEYKNDDVIHSFSKEEKEQLFQDIVSLYFRKNFGSLSKTDLETYLFSVYYDHVLQMQMDADDYIIGRDLGLTISRVRSLKERKELKYPHMGDKWKSEFLRYAQNAKFDDVHHLMKFSIPDVIVIKEVRYYFEKNNQFDEIQLNPKLFACRPDTFFQMCKQIAIEKGEPFSIEVHNSSELESYLNGGKCTDKEKTGIQKILRGSVEDGIKELLVGATKATLLTVLSCVAPGAGVVAGTVANTFIEIVKRALKG